MDNGVMSFLLTEDDQGEFYFLPHHSLLITRYLGVLC